MNVSFDLSQSTPRLASEQRTLLAERQKILPTFKKFLLSYYLFYGHILVSFCLVFSLINFFLILNTTDDMVMKPGISKIIDVAFSLEMINGVILIIDFFLKVYCSEYFFDESCYGIFYIILDCVTGPVSFTYDIYILIFFKQYTYIGFILRSFKLFTMRKFRVLTRKLRKLLVKVFYLIWSLFVIFYLFAYIAKEVYDDEYPEYFGSLLESSFTMFQFLTLDDWGGLGRTIMKEEGLFLAFYFVIFIFLMSYFFLNIFIGIVVDGMIENQDELVIEESYSNIFEKLMFGKYYDWINVTLFLSSFFEIHEHTYKDEHAAIAFIHEIAIDIIFFAHFIYIALSLKKRKYMQFMIVKSKLLLIFHFLAGPLAIMIDIIMFLMNKYRTYGHFFRVIKIFTTSTLSNFIFHYFRIFPKLTSPIILLLGVITFLSCWATERLPSALPDFFINYNLSVFSFFQVLSLDEWCAQVTRGLISEKWESALVFIFFIFLANYVLLNILLAIACFEISESKKIVNYNNLEANPLNDSSLIPKSKESQSQIFANFLKRTEAKHPYFYSMMQKKRNLDGFSDFKILEITDDIEITLFNELKTLRKKEEAKIEVFYKSKSLVIDLKMLKMNFGIEIHNVNANDFFKKAKKKSSFDTEDDSNNEKRESFLEAVRNFIKSLKKNENTKKIEKKCIEMEIKNIEQDAI